MNDKNRKGKEGRKKGREEGRGERKRGRERDRGIQKEGRDCKREIKLIFKEIERWLRNSIVHTNLVEDLNLVLGTYDSQPSVTPLHQRI